MKKQLIILFSLIIASFAVHAQTDANARLFELRVYYASEGKLPDLMNRFQNHTLKYFDQYNMRLEGFWLPLGENKENKLVYLLSYPSREARDKSWKEFMSDKGWITVMKNSAVNGEIVAKVESTFLKTTDFSPNNLKTAGNRVFELF